MSWFVSRPNDPIRSRRSPASRLGLLSALILSLGLSACSEVRFSHLPSGTRSECDSRAVGRWLSADEPDPRSALVVAPDCSLVEVVEPRPDGSIEHDPMTVTWLRTGGKRVVAVASDEPDEQGQWHLVRYRIRKDTLEIYYPDIESLAGRIDAGELAGEVISRDSDGDAQDVLVHADGRTLARLIRRGKLFRKQAEGRFIRAPNDAPVEPAAPALEQEKPAPTESSTVSKGHPAT